METYASALHAGVWAIAVLYLVSGLDELVMNIAFLVWRVYRRLFLVRGNKPLTVRKLRAKPEQRAAIMIPAWNESEVIERTLRFAVSEIDYRDYMIFVGVYPNDPATMKVVQRVIADHPNHVRLAVVPEPGPTTKSDCLNAIIRECRRWGEETGRPVDIFVLHDAEDFVPRYGLKLFNFLIPKKAIVQIPVFPIAAPWWALTEGHYMDEFAQLHLKDLRVREWLTDGIPSAGVGTGFSRKAIEMAWNDDLDGAFRKHLLTEDYEISMQLLRKGASSAFFLGNLKGAELGPPEFRLFGLPSIVAVRSEFPHRFWAAVRQKTRWTLGITLQGWESLGLHGPFWQRYLLYRDRKPLFTNIMNVVAYAVFAIWLIPWLIATVLFPRVEMPSMLPDGTTIQRIIDVDMILLFAFISIRALCTLIAYGPLHAVMSVPRLVWGNVINFVATVRAIRQFTHARRSGATNIPWEKTAHPALR